MADPLLEALRSRIDKEGEQWWLSLVAGLNAHPSSPAGALLAQPPAADILLTAPTVKPSDPQVVTHQATTAVDGRGGRRSARRSRPPARLRESSPVLTGKSRQCHDRSRRPPTKLPPSHQLSAIVAGPCSRSDSPQAVLTPSALPRQPQQVPSSPCNTAVITAVHSEAPHSSSVPAVIAVGGNHSTQASGSSREQINPLPVSTKDVASQDLQKSVTSVHDIVSAAGVLQHFSAPAQVPQHYEALTPSAPMLFDTQLHSQRLPTVITTPIGSQPQHDSTLVTHAHVTHSHERRHDRRKRRRSYSASSSSPHSRRSHRTSDQHRRRSVHSHRRSSSRRYANSRSSRRRSPSSSYEMSSESASPDREIGPARVRRESQAASRVYSPVEQCAPPGASSQGLNFSSSSAGAGVPPSMGVPPPVVGSGFQEQFSQRSTGGLALPPFSLGNSGEQLMPLVRSSVVPSTWQSYGSGSPTVWLLGHSYIFWAGQRAEFRPGGRNLGFRGLNFSWRGIKGLQWPQVLPEIVDISKEARSPVVLVLHAGGNDLCSYKIAELITIMKSDISRFHSFFQELIFVWSEIVPRSVWHGARDGMAIERTRRTINARISKFVRERFGVVIRHKQLEGDNRALLRQDGVHLTDIGLDIFLSGLQDGIEQALLLMGGGRSHV
ncbi:uncharacterized protein LOC143817270 isoform X1 [Ranitomeya variabilis]